MTLIGQEGLPEVPVAGNLLQPHITLRLSLSVSPSVDWKLAEAQFASALSKV